MVDEELISELRARILDAEDSNKELEAAKYEDTIIGTTTKCVICLKVATSFTGHVLYKDKHIIAGWCEEHPNTIIANWGGSIHYNLANRNGCYGGWHRDYGFDPDGMKH